MATAATPSGVIPEHGAEHPNYNSVLQCTVNSNEIKHGCVMIWTENEKAGVLSLLSKQFCLSFDYS